MFDLVVSLWSMIVAACATLGAIHVLVWLGDRRAHANLAFVALVAAVATVAVFELRMMHVDSVTEYAALLRLLHVPIFVTTLSIVAIVRLAFGPAYFGLGVATMALRALALAVNFGVDGNLNYSSLDSLRQVEFLGRVVSAPVGTPSAWTWLGPACNLLLVAYIIAATSAHARLGAEQRRRALVVGSGLVLCIVLSAGTWILINNGIMQIPVMVSLPFFGIVVVMAVEVSRDLAAARRVEQALHESQLRSDFAASAAGLGMFSWQAEGGQMWANAIARDMHGVGAADLPGPTRILDHVHPDDRDAVRQGVLQALREGCDFEVSYRAKTAPGQWRWIESRGAVELTPNGRVSSLHGVCLDMSERRAAEARFQRVVEAAPNAMLLVDLDGRITLGNRQAELMFGCDSSALLGRAVDDFVAGVPAATHAAHRRHFAEQPEAGRVGAGRELHARRVDGTEFVVEVRLTPITTREGPQVLASIVDLTVPRQHEHELQRLREQSLSAARISLAGQLASTLAHEINQPLGAILRNAEAASIMLERGNADLAEIAAILADIRSDDQRAGAVIEHMRALLRRKRPELASVPIEELVDKVIALVRHDASARHVALQTRIPHGIAAVRGDAVQLQQVLLNLAFNSMDSLEQVPKGSRRLSISARTLADRRIELAVRDTGPGLPTEVLARIFEPFHTTKANGMGMGLAISRSLVESMDGSIEAGNQIDGGAAFRIVLPQADAPIQG